MAVATSWQEHNVAKMWEEMSGIEMQSWQVAVVDLLIWSIDHCTGVADDCAYLVMGMYYPNLMYHLPSPPLAYLLSSQSGSLNHISALMTILAYAFPTYQNYSCLALPTH